MLRPTEILSESGPLASCIENFSVRPQQQQLAESIAHALENNESLICEAGTGTGKTFAYLVPALLSGKKIIISTATKHLQDQLFYRDLPVISKGLGLPVTMALLKGRANYLCRHRLAQAENDQRFISDTAQNDLSVVKQWAPQTKTGDLGELAELSENSPIQFKITSTTENCLGQECEFSDECFVFNARRRANDAEIVVVNHHLLLADLSLRETGFGEVLPKSDTIIFDEAHQLPELASEFFSQSISSRQIIELINDSRSAYLSDANDMPEFITVLDKTQTALKKLRLVFSKKDKRIAWQEIINENTSHCDIEEFQNSLHEMEKNLDELSQRSKSLDNCWRRCGNFISMLETFLERESDDMIQWVETKGQGFILHQTPLDISQSFQSRLAEYGCNCIYTSATLAVADDFNHFSSRLGLTEITAQTWHSPFDFTRQALLYLPTGMPDPRESGYPDAVVNAALPVIRASRGHAFLLFTSYRVLDEAAELISKRIDYPIMIQGEAPRTELLKRFRTTKHAILLGTSSFWEGVDVRGQALSCVIIDKLPFAPPDDPVLRARSAKMEENGQNPFMDYQLPEAVINLRQGVGRLIRDINDHGVLMICDPRIVKKSYGQKFLKSLPEIKTSTDISDVELFFEQHKDIENMDSL